jgi:hypothetical protein
MASIFKTIEFKGFNFSFKKHKNGYIGTIRQSIQAPKDRPSLYPECLNSTHIIELDSDFNILSSYLLDENKQLLPRYTNYCTGIEDSRLIDDKSLLCVSLDTNSNFKTEMTYVEFSNEEQKITKITRLYIEDKQGINQKNWLYLKKENDIMYLLYFYNPIQIVSLDLATGKGCIIKSYTKENIELNCNDGEFHGGACLYLEKTNKYLVSIRKITNHKFVSNYWLLFNDEYELEGISDSFIFEIKEDIEIGYQMNMSLHIENELLYAAVSINDTFVNIYKFNIDDVLSKIKLI